MYKIVAKLLARRLKKVPAIIIDERQTAFIESKHMLHNILIANEAVEEAKRYNKSCLVFKVDYEDCLGKLGFSVPTKGERGAGEQGFEEI